MKKIGLLAGFGVALAVIASTAAFALEEQKGAVAPQPPAADAPKAQVQDGVAAAKADAGTEIRIPGLGKLGTLPKMDFGLELLYGANDTSKSQGPAPAEPENGDLTIHGSIKHKF